MNEIQSKIILFLPQINTVTKHTYNKERLTTVDSKKTLKFEKSSNNTITDTQPEKITYQINHIETRENNSRLENKEKSIMTESSKKKNLIDNSKFRNKDLIKLTQITLPFNGFQNSGSKSRIIEQVPLLSTGFSSKKFSKDNILRNVTSFSNMKMSKNIFRTTKSNKKFTDRMTSHNKFYDIKFSVNSPINNYISKYNLNNIYPQVPKNYLFKKDDSKAKIYFNKNDKQIDCDELIRNFDEIKETTYVETLAIQTNISNFMILG
jgi:hypothetical protein